MLVILGFLAAAIKGFMAITVCFVVMTGILDCSSEMI